MQIKFTDKDPRAGTVAEMDSSRGQQLVDEGSAVVVSKNRSAEDEAEARRMPSKTQDDVYVRTPSGYVAIPREEAGPEVQRRDFRFANDKPGGKAAEAMHDQQRRDLEGDGGQTTREAVQRAMKDQRQGARAEQESRSSRKSPAIGGDGRTPAKTGDSEGNQGGGTKSGDKP